MPVIGNTFPLEMMVEAQELLDSGQKRGNVVIQTI